MTILQNLVYTKSHEWVKEVDANTVIIGLTDYAQSELGDLVFINLPEEGDATVAGESFADVESVKAVSDVFCPVSGDVVEVNEELLDSPENVNDNPYDAWFVKIANVTEREEFLSAAEYEAFVETQQA